MHLYLLSFYSSIMTFLNSVCILPLAPLSFSMVPLKCVLDFKIEYATEGWNNLIYIKEGNQAFFISGTSVLQIASNTLLEFNNNFNNKLHFWYTEFKALIQFYEKKKKDSPFHRLCCCSVAKSWLPLCDPMNYSLPGSSVFLGQEYWGGLPFPSGDLIGRQILWSLSHQRGLHRLYPLQKKARE